MLQSLEYTTIICYYPQEKVGDVKRWIGEKYHYLPQHGENLGERMNNCFIQGFHQGFKKLVVIGSDCPDLPDTLMRDAFQRLDRSLPRWRILFTWSYEAAIFSHRLPGYSMEYIGSI